VIYLDNRVDVPFLDGKDITIKDLNGETLSKEIHTIEWTADMAEQKGYNHFMLKRYMNSQMQ
jgi:glucosamine--fructose-6-phosphate aminotransferase (isomerizing)